MGTELFGIGLMFGSGKHVDLLTPADIDESCEAQHHLPLCLQQSTSNSARPQINIIFGVLRHFLVHNDVAKLETAARL